MKVISIQSNLRRYVYKAHLTTTGRLSKITAGCRTWKTFDVANAHYRGEGPYGASQWTDDTISLNKTSFAYRLEARSILTSILTKLNIKVKMAQDQIRVKRRRLAARLRKAA